MDVRADQVQYNPYRVFSRAQWAALRDDMPMTLTAEEVARMHSMHDRLDIDRKSTRLNSSHIQKSRMPSSA